MSPDWFDPLGLRGSKLDPFAMFTNALKGEGLAQQSADAIATNFAQRMVGQRIEIDRTPPIAATVERIDEVTPATALAAVPTSIREVPMWQLVRGRLANVSIGERVFESVDLTATGVRLVGPTAQRMRIERVDFNATLTFEEIDRWNADIDGAYVVRVNEGRLEITDRRVTRWAWLEIAVTAEEQTIVVTPTGLRVLGRPVTIPKRLQRVWQRPAPWMAAALVIDEVRVTGHVVGLRGGFDDVLVPVDVTRLLTDLGAQSTKSVLRIMLGDW